ncbi:MAG: TolC family protein [Nitrospinae bacterium]|nr:TolC family protein [Nitrospinota bacterium]MZH15598.1 TolC family protein [Nitrospinota bacterium]
MNFISNLLVCSLACFIFHILPDRVSADPLSPAPTSLSLKAAIEDTLKNNVAIAVQKYNSKINEQSIFEKEADFDTTLDFEFSAGEETRQAAGAFANPVKSRNQNYDWDFSISKKFMTGADYELSFDSNRNLTNSTFAGLNPQYTSDLNLSFTQPLLKDFGIDNNKREIYIAKNNQKISDFEFKASVIDVITEAENTYWDLVFSIEDLKVKKKSLERAQDLEKQVKAQVEVGTMAPLEMLQAQSEVASRDQLLLSAQDLIQDNEDNLKNILNYSFDSEQGRSSLNPSEPPVFDPGTEGTLEEAIQIALNDRPDLLVKKKELENRNIEVKYNENQTYPTLDLVSSLGLNGISGEAINITSGTVQGKSKFGGGYDNALSDLGSGKYHLWEFGFNLSYPLGNRAAKSRLVAKKLEVAQLLLDIKDVEKTIAVEVREAYRQIKTDIKRVHAARIARKLAEEKLSAEEKKFEVGLSTSFNVLEFQEDLAEEQSNEIKAIIDYKKSRNRLRQVKAQTLKENNIQLSEGDET